MKNTLFLFFLFVAETVCSQVTQPFADSLRAVYRIPEISYAVVDRSSILEIAAIGVHSNLLQDTATLHDRFHLASNTKAMTAFLIAHYVEKGKLNWETKFFDVFPEWQATSNPLYANITLKDLLTHRAGIQPFRGNDDPPIPAFEGSKQKRRLLFGQFVLSLDPISLDDQTPFAYSNAGYTLATLMLEKVTGKSWEQLVEKIFNRKLHLNVEFSWPENQKKKDTWGHVSENDTLTPIPSSVDFHLDYTEPAGDLNMTLKDYVRFIQMHLDGLQGHDNYLKSSTYKFLHTAVDHYALGWYNISENDTEFSSHSGTVGTYYTTVQLDRTHQRAYIIFTNAYDENTVQGVRLLMRKLKENHPD